MRDAVPGSRSQIVYLPQPAVYKDDPKVRCPDITRAKQILGWTPQVTRREGLRKMVEHYRMQLTQPASAAAAR